MTTTHGERPAVAADPLSLPPQPVPDAVTAPFWAALAEGRLAMCRCGQCGLWLQPPLERCRRCAGPTRFVDVAGTGTVYSFIVQHRATVPGYLDDLPYVVALVELDEQAGLRLPARIVGVDPAAVHCGLRVRAEFADLPGGEFTVAVFRPVDSR
ncbi:OB-fold domain-containing protein [Frankia sp. AiPs1]|uniref:Zn-ribbon domain-containing OB-fold protein n=1 Tax=Frankia sp. AiPs1 TaxID=573493 RepID=UPI0020445D96|nr:OB-fold domain-containing protein [Frankia sp. AiPs1]MCM3922626.1 OB-fold domain-containing protein [Frankia sp. AiPs1]